MKRMFLAVLAVLMLACLSARATDYARFGNVAVTGSVEVSGTSWLDGDVYVSQTLYVTNLYVTNIWTTLTNLYVRGDAVVTGDMTVSNTFRASTLVGSLDASNVVNSVWLTNNAPSVNFGTNLTVNGSPVPTNDATAALNAHISNWKAGLDPIGVTWEGQWTVSFSNSTRTFYLAPVGASADYFFQGTKLTKTNVSSVAISTNAGCHFVYFDDASGTLKEGMVGWGFSNYVQVATAFWDPITSNSFIGDELHGIDFPWSVHELLHNTLGTRYASGLTGTFTVTNFAMTAGVTYDEDLKDSIPATNRCTVFYHSGGAVTFTQDMSVVYMATSGGTLLQYDNGTNLATVGNGNYACVWVYAGNNDERPIMSVVGQRQDTSLTAARTNNTLNGLALASLPSQEMKVLYRVIYHRTGSAVIYDEAQDLRSVSTVPSGTYVPTQHSSLAGLTADDHPQYALYGGRGGWTNLAAYYNDAGFLVGGRQVLASETSLVANAGSYTVVDVRLTNNATLEVPTNAAFFGRSVKFNLFASGGDRTVTFSPAIAIPSSSTASNVFVVASNTTTKVLLECRSATNAWVESYIWGYPALP